MFTRTALSALAVLAFLAASAVAGAQTVFQGNLELVWGDAAPGSPPGSDRLIANLVLDDGRRLALDVAQARAAAGDLYALQGRRIAVAPLQALSGPEAGAGAAEPVRAAAIVSADSDQLAVAAGVSGSQPWVTLACKFSDVAAEPKTVAYFQTMLSNDAGRLDDYWRTVSYGKVNVAGSAAAGWFTLPQPRSYYVPAGSSAKLTSLFNDCTAVADASVDFSKAVGINMMFNDDLDGYAWGGNRYATLDGRYASWRVTWEPPWGYNNEAPLAHEMGHGFGLPHANNSDQDSDPYDNPWDVMSDAWHNATSDATFGTQPKHIGVYSRNRLGWVDAARKLTITTMGSYPNLALDAAELASSANLQMIVVDPPGAPATYYYTLEARRAGVAGDLYDHNLAGSAVIIHEVDTLRGEPAWSVDAQVPPASVANDAGSMFTVGESWTAPGGAFTVSVDAATSNGFLVSIDRAEDDLIFRDTF
jgi:hypothetical protein